MSAISFMMSSYYCFNLPCEALASAVGDPGEKFDAVIFVVFEALASGAAVGSTLILNFLGTLSNLVSANDNCETEVVFCVGKGATDVLAKFDSFDVAVLGGDSVDWNSPDISPEYARTSPLSISLYECEPSFESSSSLSCEGFGVSSSSVSKF
jgi:hypothetical protein